MQSQISNQHQQMFYSPQNQLNLSPQATSVSMVPQLEVNVQGHGDGLINSYLHDDSKFQSQNAT